MQLHKTLHKARDGGVDSLTTKLSANPVPPRVLAKLEDYDIQEHQQHRLTLETWIRGITLVIVIVAIVGYPAWTLVFNMDTQKMLDAIAPVTGIAGAVIGYWFGQASRRIPANPTPTGTSA